MPTPSSPIANACYTRCSGRRWQPTPSNRRAIASYHRFSVVPGAPSINTSCLEPIDPLASYCSSSCTNPSCTDLTFSIYPCGTSGTATGAGTPSGAQSLGVGADSICSGGTAAASAADISASCSIADPWASWFASAKSFESKGFGTPGSTICTEKF